MAASPGRVGRPWRTVQRQCFREETACWLCNEPVDPDVDDRDPLSRTADHLIQLQHKGPPHSRSNLRLAHRRCNSARSGRLQDLAVEDCACSLGQPCARLQPRGFMSVDASTV